MREMLIPYPYTKKGLYIRIAEVILSTAVSFYLLFNTILIEFIISFLMTFPISYIILSTFNILKTKKISDKLNDKQKYIKSKHKGETYYKFLVKIILITIAPFIIIMISPIIGLGTILGFICAHGFSEITHYAYVKNVERRLGGRLYHFISITSINGYYYTGFKVVKHLEE
ncbi:MAG: hypothetical protein NDF55_06690 [archaeon GB-1867-005]|nr:hypothetical protein [Candidatus Culexmicrobium cathedralense]